MCGLTKILHPTNIIQSNEADKEGVHDVCFDVRHCVLLLVCSLGLDYLRQCSKVMQVRNSLVCGLSRVRQAKTCLTSHLPTSPYIPWEGRESSTNEYCSEKWKVGT